MSPRYPHFSGRVRQSLLRGAGLLFFLFLALPVLPAWGQVDVAQVEVDGLVLDRTLTRMGHDFFREFVTRLGAEDGVPGFSLTVREKVSAQWGSVVTVEANDEVIFQTPLRPKGDGPGETAERAAAATAEFLLQSSGGGLRPDEKDLSEDGL